MNKTGLQIKNYYLRAALYIKLIVNNMKYRGIQCDFGRLTDLFFVTPDSQFFAVQRDTVFFQYTYCGRAFNPAQKGVLNKVGITLHKYNMHWVKRELQGDNFSNIQDSPGILNPESGIQHSDATVSEKRVSQFPNRDNTTANRNSCPKGQAGAHPVKENSTVFKIEKPSATETRFPAEGCISESRAIRACLTIRVFNN